MEMHGEMSSGVRDKLRGPGMEERVLSRGACPTPSPTYEQASWMSYMITEPRNTWQRGGACFQHVFPLLFIRTHTRYWLWRQKQMLTTPRFLHGAVPQREDSKLDPSQPHYSLKANRPAFLPGSTFKSLMPRLALSGRHMVPFLWDTGQAKAHIHHLKGKS